MYKQMILIIIINFYVEQGVFHIACPSLNEETTGRTHAKLLPKQPEPSASSKSTEIDETLGLWPNSVNLTMCNHV